MRQISKVPHNAVDYCPAWIYPGCIIAKLENSVVSKECFLLLWLTKKCLLRGKEVILVVVMALVYCRTYNKLLFFVYTTV